MTCLVLHQEQIYQDGQRSARILVNCITGAITGDLE